MWDEWIHGCIWYTDIPNLNQVSAIEILQLLVYRGTCAASPCSEMPTLEFEFIPSLNQIIGMIGDGTIIGWGS